VPQPKDPVTDSNAPRVLAISSGGGHWEQLMLLRDGLSAGNVVYVNTILGLAEKSGVSPAYVIADCNRTAPVRNIRCLIQILTILLRERPAVIISTGAAPGVIGLIIGKILGAKTIWIDSIANYEQLSLSGRMAGRFADLWITQWNRHARINGPHYFGSVI
jgi:UDP-N-acetylglucosamine:LPS N-acetylglucosamine transferase